MGQSLHIVTLNYICVMNRVVYCIKYQSYTMGLQANPDYVMMHIAKVKVKDWPHCITTTLQVTLTLSKGCSLE